ncbi:MAG: DUF3987 domain-containing protein [Sphingobacteriaceae bacterium]|nr:DUF3987 domain-containing protein [Sphingobacteriaceae bacterium]
MKKNCGYPSAVTSAAILSAVGLAIGNFIELYINSEWKEAGNLNVCIVGDKGSNKSHPITTIFELINEIESQKYKEFLPSLASWKSRKDEAKSKKETFDEPEPTWKRFTVDSTTIEKLAEILNENPRGIIVINDELRGWFKSFTQYDSDSLDKWLKIFNRARILIDRIGRGTTQINRPFVSVIGTIQPEVLDRLITPDFRECGLIDRILFVLIKAKLRYTNGELNQDLLSQWNDTLKKLLDLASSKEEGAYVHLSSEAKKCFETWKKEQIEILNSNEELRLLGGKWDNYIYRFALILHCLENLDQSIRREISKETFDKAIILTTYFQNQYYKLFGDKDNYHVRKLSELKKDIYRKLPGEFLTNQAVEIIKI